MYQKVVESLRRQRNLIDQALSSLEQLEVDEILSTKTKIQQDVNRVVTMQAGKQKRVVSDAARRKMSLAQKRRFARARKQNKG